MFVKIVVIGGGSSYTPELFDGFIRRKDTLLIDEIVLVDISSGEEKLHINLQLVRRMFKKADMNIKVTATLNKVQALIDADFIIAQIRVGGLEARELDESIPLKYDLIGQETTGAGGFAKAIRTIPVMLEICELIEKHSKKDAWLINFTNPAGMITEAVNKYTNINVLGLCNVPYNMRVNIAKSMQVPVTDVRVEFAGLNHLVYGKKVYIKGRDETDAVTEALIKGASNSMNNIPDLVYPEDLLRSLKMVPCPYHRYYYMTEELLAEEKKAYFEKGHTRAKEVMAIEQELFEIYSNKALDEKPKALEKRGGAYYSEVATQLIDAIVNDRQLIYPVNTMNYGSIKGLSDTAVVEVNSVIGKNGATPVTVGKLEASALSLLQQVKTYEELTIACVTEKKRLKGIKALYTHPLVNSFDKATKIFDEIIRAHQEHLPEFF
jgi:6-phospho-beta-glucosidase